MRKTRYRGNTPEDHAAANEHVERKQRLGISWKKDWINSESSAEAAREISALLDRPPATPDAETRIMCRAVRSRGHLHDIEALQQEKHRVLRSRRIDYVGGRQ
jgi:hypothetical protein